MLNVLTAGGVCQKQTESLQIRQPFEPDPGSTGVGKRESQSPDFRVQRQDELETVFPGHSARGRCEYGFFISMQIKINGEEKEIADGLNLGALLEELQIRPARVVVEHNRIIVSRDLYGATMLADGDALEIVHFVGGG